MKYQDTLRALLARQSVRAMMRVALTCAVLFGLPRCKDNSPRDYFPLAVGHRWFYDLNEYGDVGEAMVKVADKTGSEYTMQQEVLSGDLYIGFPFALDEDVYFTSSDSGVAYEGSDSFPLLKSQLEVGDTWSSGGDSAWVSDKVTVSVPAGNFEDCYRVGYRIGGEQSIIWYAPNVGIVRILTDEPIDIELLSTNF